MKFIPAIVSLLPACAHGFSAPAPATEGHVKIGSWTEVKEGEGVGRRYGPNWSVGEDLMPVETPGKTGAMVWAIDDKKYVHPEQRPDTPVGEWLLSRPNLGICMSGGGQRAATCALGWYRALVASGILTKARYVGANSGATWTTLPLFCRQMLEMKERRNKIDYEKFVGKYMGKIDTDRLLDLQDELSVISKIIFNADVMKYEENEENASFNAWCDAIQQNYVGPMMAFEDFKVNEWANDFWLDLSNAYLWNTDANKDILNENSFPFPIFVATAYDSANNQDFFPVENTPLYSGIPVDPKTLGVDSDIGGGFIQGVALNSASLDNTDPVPVCSESTYIKEFDNPSPVVKVAELTGASSNFGASGDAMVKVDLQNKRIMDLAYKVGSFFDKALKEHDLSGFTEPGKYKWWSPSTGGEPHELNFVDGGMFDNLGVLAVLRRGCSTVLVCDACDGDVVETPEEDVSSKFYDVAALFGKSKPFMPEWMLKKGYKDTVNERSQVFEAKEFDALMNDMRELRKVGKPLVVRKKLTLQVNEMAGIFESREVDMIFCFNGLVEEFEEDKRTRDRKGNIEPAQFPYIDTTLNDYSVTDVQKLSHLNAYNLLEGLKNADFDISQVEY